MAVRNVEYIISLRDNFSNKLAGINKNLKVTGQRIQSIGKTMSLAVTLPIVALGATAVKLASDFEETESKFNTVFSSIRQQATDTAKNLKNNFGLSSRAALQLLGDTGDLLVGFGFTESAALEMSRQVNELAVDLASFTNVQGGAQSASAALTKALLGERESIKTLGISILESDVKARVLLNTQKGLRFESVRQAKAVATLQLATEQSSKAIGDFERTSQSFANQMRITRARLEDLGIQIGKILLPLAQKLLKIIKGWIESFSKLSPETKRLIVVISGLAAALGPLLIILGFLITTLLPALSVALVALTGPVGLVVAAIGIATFEIIRNWDKIVNYFTEGPAAETWREFQILTEKIFGLLPKNIEVSTKLITRVWDNFISRFIEPMRIAFEFLLRRLRLFTGIFGDIIDIFTASFKGNWIRVWDEIKSIMKRVLNFMIDSLRVAVVQLLEIIQRPLELIGEGGFIQPAIDAVNDLAERFSFVTENAGSANDQIKAMKTNLAGVAALGGGGGGGIVPRGAVAPTRITSAAPRTFNITIDSLIENFSISTTNLREGTVAIKEQVTQALLTGLTDVQIQVR